MKHPSQATILLFALGGQSRGSGVSRLQMTQVSTAIPPSYPQRHPLSPDTCREQAFPPAILFKANGNSIDEGFSALPTTREEASDRGLLVVTGLINSNPKTSTM